MAGAGKSVASAPPLSATELRQLWERGQHRVAIRAALNRWDQLVEADGQDLHWLQDALRRCGLQVEAFALQTRMTRRRANRDEWEALIGSVLRSGDPWWARELLDEVGGATRNLQALRIEVALALGDASELISAWVREHDDAAARESAAGWWVRNGRVDEAQQLANRAALPLWQARLALWRNEPNTARQLLIERFAGNHTPHLTLADGAALRSYALPQNPGQLGVSIQLVLRTRGVQAVRDLYRSLAPSVSNHPRFRLYQGETELWMGAYEDAARIFRAILSENPKIMWAWIGLGASAMLQGNLQEAQEIWTTAVSAMAPLPFKGPTLFIYRGECYRRQGKMDEARRDLEAAVREKPSRLSAWINLALLDGEGERMAWVERKCVELAPLLMEGLSGSTADKLEQVLEAMRGNRSSSRVSYHLWGRVWHFMTHGVAPAAS